ncbi:hypothetical protein Taro_032324 [Colocasia esculenta]|uniref:Protein MIZU-KUSSEI 1 n=1 Tax=Colocasia esculenta TaxID=4460 RepID=A0A843VX12_COLES|nr:hypothetical protein [Colocasia esculenta]
MAGAITKLPKNDTGTGMDADVGDGRPRQYLTWLLSRLRPVLNHLLPCWPCRPQTVLFVLPSFLGRLLPDDATSTVTGTILCPQHDKVRLCLQADPSSPPLILLDLPITTPDFAAEIHGGGCRIAFQCCGGARAEKPLLEAAEAWAVFLNGRRAGFASRRRVTEREARLLEATCTVSAGAGFLPPVSEAGDAMAAMGRCGYLRGRFERVVGCTDSESYHLVDPDGYLGQELSLFFLRRR